MEPTPISTHPVQKTETGPVFLLRFPSVGTTSRLLALGLFFSLTRLSTGRATDANAVSYVYSGKNCKYAAIIPIYQRKICVYHQNLIAYRSNSE